MKRRSTFTANGELTLSRRVVQQIVEARLQEGELQRREQQKVAARRQQQIAAAVAVLAPKLKTEKDHARCRAKIGKVLDTIDASVAFDDAFREWRGSAVSKRAVRAYIKVLRRAAVAHKQLPPNCNAVSLN